MVLRKSFYIRWSAGRSPRVHEVNPGRDPSYDVVTLTWSSTVMCDVSANVWRCRDIALCLPVLMS